MREAPEGARKLPGGQRGWVGVGVCVGVEVGVRVCVVEGEIVEVGVREAESVLVGVDVCEGVCEAVEVGVREAERVLVGVGVTAPASDTTAMTPAYCTEPSEEKCSVSAPPVALKDAGRDVPLSLPSWGAVVLSPSYTVR